MDLEDIEDRLLSLLSQSSDLGEEVTNDLIRESSNSDTGVARLALDRGYLDEYDLRGYLEEATGYESYDPTYLDWQTRDKEEYTRLLPQEFMTENYVMPINKKNNELGLVMLNPTDEALRQKVHARTGLRTNPYVSHRGAFQKAFEINFEDFDQNVSATVNYEQDGYFFEPLEDLRNEARSLINADEDWKTDDEAFGELLHRTPILLFTQELLNQVIAGGGSDIHFEPLEDRFRVRVRRDGTLRTLWTFPPSFGPVIVGRLRLISQQGPRAESKPTDGRIGYSVIYDRDVEFRVSTLPVLNGEKMVLRSIYLDEKSIPLDKMGFRDRDLQVLRKSASEPTGMILVTGPTGSGKTTTLYSIIEERHEESVSITTAEDPVEAELEGIAQVSCTESAEEGVTFTEALKSFLRQDPDIIMVGEIRDRETGEIAMEASMTGHLVVSTLHTNSAAETINRLLNMELEPYLISAGLSVVVAQRLVRTLCEECKQPAEAPEDLFRKFDLDPDEFRETTFFEPVGCEHCDEGYDGRTGLFEVLRINDNIREAIFAGESTQAIEKRARDQGFATLKENGFQKVREGVTTLQEVLANTV